MRGQGFALGVDSLFLLQEALYFPFEPLCPSFLSIIEAI
jgi:hypothetical protein